jgi:ubiquitin-like-conjugating enzyme ATG3
MTTKRFFYEKFKEFANAVSGPMTESAFQKTGKLTPQEFVEAGDALTQKFPGWKWEAGDATIQDYLPKNKKYLVLKECPCRERAAAIDASAGPVDDKADADGWVDSGDSHAAAAPAAAAAAPAAAAAAPAPQQAPAQAGAFKYDLDEEDEDDDPNAAPASKAVQANSAGGAPAAGGANALLRFYNIVVSYDQFYCSPRMYLFGYKCGAQNVPLTKEEMMEDVYSANREKTATIDPHPFVKAPCISIHPCRHAEMMKRTLDRLESRFTEEQEDVPEGERIPFVFPTYMALFVFLKFITAVVPTIGYDVTIDMEM